MTKEEAIKKIKTWDFLDNDEKEVLETLIPELKESDDERIRKDIIKFLIDVNNGAYTKSEIEIASWIAWLEKQNKHKDYYTKQELIDIGFSFTLNGDIVTPDKMMEDMKKYLAWKEKQAEQKPTDKVESKFKVGDWIIRSAEGFKHNTYLVKEVKDYYVCEELKGRRVTFTFNDVNKNFKLWTIQDAKDGDVLFSDLMGGKTFIYNGVNSDKAILYSFIISNDGEDVLQYYIGKPNTGIGNIEENKNIIHPATKEQHDLLFQKMKDAGYEWDDEKKELRKIEKQDEWEYLYVFDYTTGSIYQIEVSGDKREAEEIISSKGLRANDCLFMYSKKELTIEKL